MSSSHLDILKSIARALLHLRFCLFKSTDWHLRSSDKGTQSLLMPKVNCYVFYGIQTLFSLQYKILVLRV